MAIEGSSTKPIAFSMIPGLYCRRRRRFTILVLEEMKFFEPLTLLIKFVEKEEL